MDFAEQLSAALKQSAEEAAVRAGDGTGVLTEQFRLPRHAAGPTAIGPAAEAGPAAAAAATVGGTVGEVCQVNTFDQYHGLWGDAIRQAHGPKSICGYLSAAYARHLPILLAEVAAGREAGDGLTQAHFDKVVATLRDPDWNKDTLLPTTRQHLLTVQQWRNRWVEDHPADFSTKRAQDEYESAWAANYEVSDLLRADAADPKMHAAMQSVRFLRYNQWPERKSATHEELQRMDEEKRFGGRHGDKGDHLVYDEGDSQFIVETYAPERELLTPAEYMARPGRTAGCTPRVYVLDLNGHYVASFAAKVAGVRKLVVVQTMPGRLIPAATSGDAVRDTQLAALLGPSVPAVAFDLAWGTETDVASTE